MARACSVAVLLLILATSAVADELTVLSDRQGGVAPREMMHTHLMGRVYAAMDRRDAMFETLKTADQMRAYQQRMRHFFLDALGGLPERTPLNARVVAKIDRDGYRIEKIIFESQPGLFVTALLYLPDAKPPYPGVLVPCGHSANGKAYDGYQRVSVLLALNGMAALCYDPIDQGERFQLLDEQGRPRVGGTTAHSMLGVGSTLLGRNTATFRVFDGMRAIDYLQSRPEVDPKRIGCTGNSGGGTLTSYLMALDERIVCAAPSCYLTSFRRLMETIGPQDAEQDIFGQIAFGMGHLEYITMRAPKPTLLCTATHDFFDIDGTWDTFRQAKRYYTRQGFAERIDLIETDQKHGFTTQLRVGAVRWMRRWLMDVDDPITEPDFSVLTDEEAQCTPQGQVMLLENARNTYDINMALEEKLAKARKQFWQETETTETLNEALDEVRRITGIRPLDDLPQPKVDRVGTIERDGYRIDRLVIHPEPGIFLPALAWVPEKRSGDAYLYLNAAGKQADAGADGSIEKLLADGHLVLAVDLRGLGETTGPVSGKAGIARYVGPQWPDLYLAYLLGTSYLKMRTEDALVCARYLADYETDEKNRVHLIAIGRVGPVALHAAALEPDRFASLTLKQSVRSWSSVVRTPMAENQFVNVVHGALKTYDLPDLLATLPKETVTIEEPYDASDK